MEFKNNVKTSGEYLAQVKDKNGKVLKSTGWKKNLLLDFACTDAFNILDSSNDQTVRGYRAATVGSPEQNKQGLLGTFSQVDNTVTSDGQTNFQDGNFRPGDNLLFSNGLRALIQSVDSSTQVTVFENQSVSNSTVIHYRTARYFSTATAHGEVLTMTQISWLDDNATNTASASGVFERSADAFTSEQTTSFEIDVLYIGFAVRIVLDETLFINPGNVFTLAYRVRSEITNPASSYVSASPVDGWPFQNEITNISSDGSKIDVICESEHALEAGDNITISGAVPQDITASTIVANGTLWTITAGTHNFIAGDTIVVVSNSGNYDGTFSVNTVIDNDNFTISNTAVNGSDAGNVRLETPTNYYNGDWLIASVTPTTIEITSTLPASLPSSISGNVGVVNANYQLNLLGDWRSGITPSNNSPARLIRIADTEIITSNPIYNDTISSSGFTTLPTSAIIGSQSNINSGHTSSQIVESVAGSLNVAPRIKQLYFDTFFAERLLMTFDEVQRKPNTHNLTLTFSTRFTQDLP